MQLQIYQLISLSIIAQMILRSGLNTDAEGLRINLQLNSQQPEASRQWPSPNPSSESDKRCLIDFQVRREINKFTGDPLIWKTQKRGLKSFSRGLISS
jgi:hypothetical protein